MADLLAGLDRAREADLARDGVRRHEGAEVVAAAHDVDHAWGEDLLQQLADLQRRQRGVGRGLEHQRVARKQGRCDLPEARVSGKFHGVMAATTPSGRRASST